MPLPRTIAPNDSKDLSVRSLQFGRAGYGTRETDRSPRSAVRSPGAWDQDPGPGTSHERLVPGPGIEPGPSEEDGILSPERLPVPPPRRAPIVPKAAFVVTLTSGDVPGSRRHRIHNCPRIDPPGGHRPLHRGVCRGLLARLRAAGARCARDWPPG